MPVCNGQALLANDEQPERGLGPAGRSQDHKEALDVCDTGGVVYTHSRSIEEVDSALLDQSCSKSTVG